MAWQIGVDVGGTFTDLLALDPKRGVFRVAKVPSTPKDQSVGFIAGLAVLETDLAAVAALIHGTTVATNAVLERKGARCGLITTAGFRDVLELGRRTRPNPYGMTGSFEALIPRDLRAEVPERIDAAGRVLTPLDGAAVRQAVHRLLEHGAEALVIHFIHAYANPAHEQRCAEIARTIWPNRFVTLGSEILREVREFERGSTAALNGYVQPIVSRYLGRLSQNLRSAGLTNDLLVMQGNGGMMAAGMATDLAVHTIMSGPAAGAIAAARIGVQAGHPNLVACDMGGTSFDVSLIAAGEPALSAEKDIAYGVPLRVPLVDIHTIGAGGGSIARITRAGLLQVGPESAGARPGPIAYGRGGNAVTVTDANLLLGRLNPDRLTGVAHSAPMERIAAAIEEQIGVPLGLDAIAAGAAILAVTSNQLAHAIRLVSVEKGHDPRDFALFAFGGAGPLHAVEIARELGIPTVLVPRFIIDIVLNNIRVADERIGDIRAQLGALSVGEKRLTQLLDRYGVETVDAAIAELKAGSERLMRAHIDSIPDGTYSATAIVDSDGIVDRPLEVVLDMTVSGSDIHFDLSRSSPPCRGPMNSVWATTQSAIYVAMKHIFPDVPINAGCFAPIHIAPPDNTFLYARYPRPVAGCAAEVAQRIMEAVFGAMGKAIPERLFAAPAGTSGNFGLGGYDPEEDRHYIMYLFSGGGYGGWWRTDGLTNGCSSVGISKTQPVEILEQHYPILFDRFALREGSGGAGRHRGGFGVDYQIRLLRGEAKASFLMDHGRVGPPGLLGGSPGAVNEISVSQAGVAVCPPHLSKGEGYVLAPGDWISVKTPGGGGYGPAEERDPAMVQQDIARGYYTDVEAFSLFTRAAAAE